MVITTALHLSRSSVVAAVREVCSFHLTLPSPILTSELAEPSEPGERRRKKRNRSGDASDKKAANLTGLPTMIKAKMTNEQLEAYTLHLRI